MKSRDERNEDGSDQERKYQSSQSMQALYIYYTKTNSAAIN